VRKAQRVMWDVSRFVWFDKRNFAKTDNRETSPPGGVNGPRFEFPTPLRKFTSGADEDRRAALR